jgi:hypothetical protein
VIIAKQQTLRHKIKIFRKNGKSCDIVFDKDKGKEVRYDTVLLLEYNTELKTFLKSN